MLHDRTPPREYAPDAYDPLEGEEAGEPAPRFTFVDLWWCGALATFGAQAAVTIGRGLPLGYLLADAAAAAGMGFVLAVLLALVKRVWGA